jgi:hypothetical protein
MLEIKKAELKEITKKIKDLQKKRKALYNYIYITEMREKEKKTKENVN